MKITHKVSIIVLGVILFITAITGYRNFASSVNLIDGAKRRELQSVATLIEEYLQGQVDKASARASLVAGIPAIQAAFRAHDRKELIRRLLPVFLLQREKFGVREAAFSLAPATSFLRLFDLKNFGEDLSAFREMILATNVTQESQQGVEIGRRGLSIRGMTVVKDDQGVIGSFEVWIDFSTLVNAVKKISGFEVGVFVDDELMSSIATAFPRPDKDRIIGGLQNVESTDWAKIHPIITADLFTKMNDITYKIQTVGGVDYGLTIVPLLDFKGLEIGAIVAVRNFEIFRAQMEACFVNAVTSALGQAVILAAIVFVVFNALVIRPMTHINDTLSRLADEDINVEIGKLPQTEDELGSLAQHIAKLKKISANSSSSSSRDMLALTATPALSPHRQKQPDRSTGRRSATHSRAHGTGLPPR